MDFEAWFEKNRREYPLESKSAARDIWNAALENAPQIVVVLDVNGGIVNTVRSNRAVRVITLDEDIEGGSCADVHQVNGEEVYVIDQVAEVAPQFVAETLAQVDVST
jgi:PAS domain-containing protein